MKLSFGDEMMNVEGFMEIIDVKEIVEEVVDCWIWKPSPRRNQFWVGEDFRWCSDSWQLGFRHIEN